MTYGTQPEPKKDNVAALISPIPAIGSIIFHVTGWIFVSQSDTEGARSFFILAIFLAVAALLMSVIALLTPKRKKGLALFVFIVSGIGLALIFQFTPTMYGGDILDYLGWRELFNIDKL